MSNNILTIIFGAGASHDCFSYHTRYNAHQFMLPLTDNIFDHPEEMLGDLDVSIDGTVPGNIRHKLLQRFNGVRLLARAYADVKNKSISLEEFLVEKYANGNENDKWLVNQVPFFMRAHIGGLGQIIHEKFIDTSYDMLIQKLDYSDYDKIVLLTLNYDILLDHALEARTKFNMRSLDCYAGYSRAGKTWHYVKYHGSVHWYKQVKREDWAIGDEDYNVRKLLDEDFNYRPLIEGNKKTMVDFHYNRFAPSCKDIRIPLMMLPYEEKVSYVCDKPHVDSILPLLEECEKFWIIGNSMRDKNINDLIVKRAKNVKELLVVDKAELHGYPGRMASSEQAKQQWMSRVMAVFPHDLKWHVENKGFSTFVKNLTRENINIHQKVIREP